MVGKIKRKSISILMILTFVISLSSGCGNVFGKQNKYEEQITIDVFDCLANFQGIQYGWFAKVIEKKFNMKLNIIAPNVAGGGSTIFDTRCAAGNLGDLIICNGDSDTLSHLVNDNLIIDMSSYIKNKQIMRFETAISALNKQFDGNSIYAIPSEISSKSPSEPSELVEPTFGPYLRWDLYSQLGYPQISTLEDLLPILKDMQNLCPVAESGEKTYGFSFFKDWDANLVNAVKQPCCFYGYDEIGFVLAQAEGKEFQNIVDSDSLYVRVLRFFNKANQMGLVDPESRTQNLDIVTNKYKNGSILFSPWSWLSQTQYNTAENKKNGIGYMMVPIDDMQIFSYGCNVYGNQQTVMCVGSNSKYTERIIDFIDWIYSDEGIYYNCAQSCAAAAGPEGFTWEMTEEGPALTENGIKAFVDMRLNMPADWGGGTWEDGVSALNFRTVAQNEIATNGYTYHYNAWDSFSELTSTKLDMDWQQHMNADTTMEYLLQNDMLVVAPGCQYINEVQTSEIDTIRKQCCSIISKFSWNMIFAENDTQFDALLKEMQDTLKYLDYDKVLAADMKTAFSQDLARKQSAARNQHTMEDTE